MRRILICLLALIAFSQTPAYAGSGHDHSHGPVTMATTEQVLEVANDIIASFVKANKIDSSFKEVTPSKPEKKNFKNGQEWIVTFKNAKIPDPKKNTLYVFISLGGKYIAANYTGI